MTWRTKPHAWWMLTHGTCEQARAALACGHGFERRRKARRCMLVGSMNLRRIFLDYLLAGHFVGWPGGDALTEDDVLDCYPRAIAAGAVPGLQELCCRHMELVAELQNCFRLNGWLDCSNSPTAPA